MTKQVMSVLVIALLVIAVFGVSSDARSSRAGSSKVEQLKSYSFNPAKAINDETRGDFSSGRSTSQTSLGAFTADGGSPGYIIGRTMRDDIAHLNPGRFVDWRNTPDVHFVFPGQLLGGHDDAGIGRWIEYTMFNPTTPTQGVFLTNVWIQSNPLSLGGWYPNIDVDETGHALPTGEEFLPADVIRLGTVFWDFAGAGNWGAFIPDPLDQSISLNPQEYMMYPRIEYQEYDGKTIVHVLVNEDSGDEACDMDAITYWRKELDSALAAGTWTTQLVTDFVWSNHFDISAARGNGKVGIAWIEWPDWCEGGGEMDGIIFVKESTDGGVSWGATEQITDLEWEYQPWVDVAGTYDTDNWLHIVYNSAPGGTITPSRVYHWTNRIPGDDGGGTTSLITIVDGFEHYCGRGGSNVALTGKPMISQCDTLLYVTWTQYGRWQDGDTLDCTADGSPSDFGAPAVNAEIYVSVSSSLNGSLWDLQRNLTNSHTPDCDGTDENNCDHDTYGTMARYGMNTASMGDTYWGAVPAAFTVRDALEPGFPDDGWYLDFQYINDLYPEPARYLDDQENTIWTYNPIKWFRLPCVQPIIAPRIYITQPDFEHPIYWVHTTDVVTVDLEIQNLGNAPLEVTGITEAVDETWLTVLTSTPFTIPPASSSITQFEIDASSYAIGTITAIEAELVISSNDTTAGDISYFINSVVADSVVQVTHDTVSTESPVKFVSGVSLHVSSNGNAGYRGVGGANLDFSAMGECQEGIDIYLFDLSPVCMFSAADYSWNPFWDEEATLEENFQPVYGAEEPSHTQTDGYDVYSTGTFVAQDSSLGFTKLFIAPRNDAPYVIERWAVYSYDGATHTGASLGTWIDWDAPSFDGASNVGGVVDDPTGTDYVWQQGIVDLDEDPPPCIPWDARFGVSGMLGLFWASEYAADNNVNDNDLIGGFVLLDADIFTLGEEFIADSAWARMLDSTMWANNTDEDDQQAWLTYGTFDVVPDDTLYIYSVHGSILEGDEDSVQALIDDATAWYLANRGEFHQSGCCGIYTEPAGYTGNANCSDDGKLTLSDISRMIDFLYISKQALCCYASGNTNGSWDDGECKITLSDISKLIDALYISKQPTAECMSGCER